MAPQYSRGSYCFPFPQTISRLTRPLFVFFPPAFGDMRAGHGTIGGRPPEGMLNRKVPIHESQDVYALAHLMLVTFTKIGCKKHNMWISKVSDAGATEAGDVFVWGRGSVGLFISLCLFDHVVRSLSGLPPYVALNFTFSAWCAY